ncbi:MAG: hypothetical protein JST92_24105 [Deltaproteobacteria bacterium]|nr:hypothetical protein [Deltaproteobacteria bacterium]
MRLLSLLLVVAAAAVGLGRDVSVHAWKESWPPRAQRIDDRFAAVRKLLPPDERIGFVSDLPGELSGKLQFDALYALAPRIVVPGTGPRVVLAGGSSEFVLRVCVAYRLQEVARVGDLSILEHL